MWWNKPKPPEKSRREQLLEAQDKLQQQIATAQLSVHGNSRFGAASYTTNDVAKAEIAELSAILAQIQDELADETDGKDAE